MSSMSRSYSALEPSHQTTRAGRVSAAASSTHFSATLLMLMSLSSPFGRELRCGSALGFEGAAPATLESDCDRAKHPCQRKRPAEACGERVIASFARDEPRPGPALPD